MTRCGCAVVLLLTVGPSAASQTPAAKAPPGCRTYSAHETRNMATPIGQDALIVLRCAYNKSTNELTCRGDSRSAAANYSYELTFVFEKLDDFIGDPNHVTFFGHPQRVISKHTGAGLNLLARTTYTYDVSRRLTRVTGDTGVARTEESMTAWDTVGRPTAAVVGPNLMSYAYDDVKRTAAVTNKSMPVSIVKYFDVNGIETGEEQIGPAGKVRNTWTIHATATVCK